MEEADSDKDEEDSDKEEIEGVNLEGRIVAKRIKELMSILMLLIVCVGMLVWKKMSWLL